VTKTALGLLAALLIANVSLGYFRYERQSEATILGAIALRSMKTATS
jgi:hypothetical protein